MAFLVDDRFFLHLGLFSLSLSHASFDRRVVGTARDPAFSIAEDGDGHNVSGGSVAQAAG